MVSRSAKERVAELRTLLNKAAHAYYVLDEPFLEDTIYDRLYRELRELEYKYPELIAFDSPTQRIGGEPSNRFERITHKVPLYSLDNAFNLSELDAWNLRLRKIVEANSPQLLEEQPFSLVAELKIDGNAIALTYENGLLINAATRGDGEEGEDITNNVRTISSVPLRLLMNNPPPWLEVRGEAFIPNQTFSRINNERRQRSEPIFANPRNACAGTLRQLDPKIVASRHLDFFAYTMHLPDEWESKDDSFLSPKCQWDAIHWLKRAGFKINSFAELIKGMDDLVEFTKKWDASRQDLPYEIDGLVLKINDFSVQLAAGFTKKAPRWAIALKFAAEEAPSELLRLTCQVGRTGAVTPVAEFEPVLLAGTKVSRATLHNADRLAFLDLHIGDTIVIRKAGEIIPEVVRVLKELRIPNSESLKLPNLCPECSSELQRGTGKSVTRCTNNSCPAILRGTLRHWVSKSSLDVEGFGDKLIEQLVDKSLVNSIAELYKLDLTILASLERMGLKSAKNLLSSLELSKKKPWHKQLYGLGIEHVGQVNARILADNFTSASMLSDASLSNIEAIRALDGIGPEIAFSVKSWFEKPLNQALLLDLKKVGFSLEKNILQIQNDTFSGVQKSFALDGKTFVLTGTMQSLTRSEAQRLIEESGGKVSSSVSTKTSYVVSGENPGKKLIKAKQLGIEIIDEVRLRELL